MNRKVIESPGTAWMKDHVCSPALKVGDLVFVSGLTTLGADGYVSHPGDIAAQAEQVFKALAETLKAAGGKMDDLVDLMIFTRDTRDIETVLGVFGKHVKKDYPAVTTAASVGLHDSRVLVCVHAIANTSSSTKQCHTPETIKWWRNYPMSAGCRKGDLVFLAGQMGADADGYVVAPGNHAAQARFSYNRIKETVEALGGTTDDIIDLITFNHDVRGMDPTNDTWFSEICKDTPLSEVAAVTSIGMAGVMKFGATSTLRAVADITPGKRIARTPASIWWKIQQISGGTIKKDGKLVALAGQVASDGDGNITTPGDHAAQSRYCFNRLREVLAEFGGTMDDIVSVMPFHKDPRAWPIALEVAKEYFTPGRGPCWTPVGSTGLYREGYLHEIYAMAVI